MGFNEKMTALADEVRILSGVTEEKSLDDLISDATAANDEVDTQTELIGQIMTALDGKTGGSGGGEDVTDETNAYTTKISELETAISALDTELEGKASGGSGGGNIETCTVTFLAGDDIWYEFTYIDLINSHVISNSDSFQGNNSLMVVCNSVLLFTDGSFMEYSVESNDGLSFIQDSMVYIGTSDTTITFSN